MEGGGGKKVSGFLLFFEEGKERKKAKNGDKGKKEEVGLGGEGSWAFSLWSSWDVMASWD